MNKSFVFMNKFGIHGVSTCVFFMLRLISIYCKHQYVVAGETNKLNSSYKFCC
jgi:hypothetical protein